MSATLRRQADRYRKAMAQAERERLRLREMVLAEVSGGMTQRQVREVTGLTPVTVNKWVNAK